MKILVVLSVVGLSVAFGHQKDDIPAGDGPDSFRYFQRWQSQHGKAYSSLAEVSRRYTVFLDNMKKAVYLNSQRKNGSSAKFGATKFADLTAEEFRQTILMDYKPMANKNEKLLPTNGSVAAPEEFDWTETAGVVTPIKDQGSAGTCWAFAGLANVESLYGVQTGQQCPDLSPESLNDCDGYSNIFAGAVACGPLGATMPAFYIWLMEEGGVMSEKDYPYCVGTKACSPCEPPNYNRELCGARWPVSPCSEAESCEAKYDKSRFVEGVKLRDYAFLVQDEELLKDGLVEVGPLVAGIDATDLQLYKGGILSPTKCDPERLNHAVLLVGYGVEGQDRFWRGKNSWGTSWGEKGFFRIVRDVGACGINADVSTAVLEG